MRGDSAKYEMVDIWATSGRNGVRHRPRGADLLTLVPGDEGGGEFPFDRAMVTRCRELFARLDEEYMLT
nr:ParA family protein [Micromonospora sp. DSM 115978]